VFRSTLSFIFISTIESAPTLCERSASVLALLRKRRAPRHLIIICSSKRLVGRIHAQLQTVCRWCLDLFAGFGVGGVEFLDFK
jgi:hypothetical protein